MKNVSPKKMADFEGHLGSPGILRGVLRGQELVALLVKSNMADFEGNTQWPQKWRQSHDRAYLLYLLFTWFYCMLQFHANFLSDTNT